MMKTNEYEATVLWVDMLGYKNWLTNKKDLKKSLKLLKSALSVAFSKGSFDNVSTILISDTLLCYTRIVGHDAITSLLLLYQFLAIYLGRIGLPLRGCLARGSLLVNKKTPQILLGDVIVKCASIEPKINAFVVVVDSSVTEYIMTMGHNEAIEHLKSTLPPRKVCMKNGEIEMHVAAWVLPMVADAILSAYKLLLDRVIENDVTVKSELLAFIPKFINSNNMINTLIHDWDGDLDFKLYHKNICEEWQYFQGYAASLLTVLQNTKEDC